LFRLLRRLLSRGPDSRRRPSVDFVPQGESLENRALFSVSNLVFHGSTLVIQSNDTATNAEVRLSGANIEVKDLSTNRTWTYAATAVGAVEFQGGAANDRFVDYVANLSLRGYGFGGDDTLVGAGANDLLYGGAGNDVLLGMAGNDQLYGGDGNDRLNGGAGNDSLWGQNGDDVLITIDNGTGDYAEGGAGRDVLWVDQSSPRTDQVVGTTSEDKVQLVASFANGADRTLDGDRLADPSVKSGQSYAKIDGNPLFSSAGPAATDIRQGALGDCYMLAGLSAVAKDNPQAIRQDVVDFDDGTYGVAFGGRFYRVDNDLPVYSGSKALAYAQLGAQNSMWVAVMEKAWAYYRTSAKTYASIEGGWSIEVNRALGSTSAGERDIQSYANATNLLNDLANRLSTHQAVTMGFLGLKAGTNPSSIPLVMMHMYTVMSVVRNSSGTVTGVVLRNPWGVDGAGNDANRNDGLVTLTGAQLLSCYGRVNWGAV
jgi:hypothetical protein